LEKIIQRNFAVSFLPLNSLKTNRRCCPGWAFQ